MADKKMPRSSGRVNNVSFRAGKTGSVRSVTSGKYVSTGTTERLTDVGQRAATVAAALGSKSMLATFLSVSASQPTQWIKGVESPNPENARTIVDIDHVIARAGLLWSPSVVSAWLVGSNAFLDGARPIDVVKTRGAEPVIDALDQELAGAYA
ncbi:hypothetical protein [Microbacterium sp.]|uniref:hypothetical protein n=1 Tax=Microbacterium sp. TaxID=51671 RepID=UPI003C189FFB